jgi:predicted class III extradiol MEMO1 family dioxygenase
VKEVNNIVITNQINIPKFTTAHDLLIDKFSIEISINNNKKNRIIELTLGDKVCFVKPSSNLVYDTIVKGHLSKRHGGLESPTVFVLVGDNKFDFYNIVEIANRKYKMNLDTVLNNTIVTRVFTIYQLAEFLITNLEKNIKKYKSKLFIITGDFYLRDPQISKQEKDWLYSQMIKATNNITDSIIIMFSPIKLTNLQNVLAK